MRALILAAALFAAAPAVAADAPASTLTLVDPAASPSRPVIIDGARWSCEGATCTASNGSEQPAARACRRVVQRLGAVSAFTYKGVTLTDEQIAACNA